MKIMLLTGIILITLSCIPREDPPERQPELILQRNLPAILDENSGMIAYDDLIWFINDSGNDSALYGYDRQKNEVTRTIHVKNATNTDWEDITQNDQYIFVGDFGNNATGNRTDLRIYMINKSDMAASDTVIPSGIISFTYEDQTDFTAQPDNQTEFDCEAFIATNDAIILFSKNWITNRTRLYILPIIPGNQVALIKNEWNVGGLVTSACWSGQSGILNLMGYTETLTPVMWQFTGFNTETLDYSETVRTDFNLLFTQTEGILMLDDGTILISSEKFNLIQPGTPASLFQYSNGN